MALPVHQSFGQLTIASGLTAAAVPVPSGVAAGDVIVVQLYKENSAAITPPAGFTQKSQVTSSDTVQHTVFWKRATGADAGTYSFTWTGSTFAGGSAHRISGAVSSGDPFDVIDHETAGAASTSTPAVTFTTNGPDRLLVWLATGFNGSNAWTQPGGYTEVFQDTNLTAAWVNQAAAGSSGSVTGSTTDSDVKNAFLGAVLPDAGGDGDALWRFRLQPPGMLAPMRAPLAPWAGTDPGASVSAATAPAEAATATGSALDATVDITPTGDQAAATASAPDPQGAVGAQPDVAAGTGAADNAQGAVGAQAEATAATGAALDGQAAVGAQADPYVAATTRYTFDATDEGWVGEGTATVARDTGTLIDGAGTLKITKTWGVGADNARANDASGLADDLSAGGLLVAVKALVPNGAAGTGWTAHVEVQDASFNYQAGPDVSLTPGVVALLTYQPPAGLLNDCRAIAVQFNATGVNGSQSVFIDTVTQGSAWPAGAGRALNPTVSTANIADAPAEAATATGSADNASVDITATAGQATGSGAAQDPQGAVGAQPDQATGTGAALDGQAAITVNAGVATGTGAALDATVSTETILNAPADVATGIGAAPDPGTAVTISAGVATGTGTANNPVAQIGQEAPAGVAAATGTALDASVLVGAAADVATGTGVAVDPTATVTAVPGYGRITVGTTTGELVAGPAAGTIKTLDTPGEVTVG